MPANRCWCSATAASRRSCVRCRRPAPEAVGTVVLMGLDAATGVAAASAALGSPYSVSGAAWLPAEAAARVPELAGCKPGVALARIEDFAPSVAYRTGRLGADLAG